MATLRTRRILTTGVRGKRRSSLRGVKASIPAGRGVNSRFFGRRAWLLRFGCALVAPAVFLVLLEGGLFAAGVGRPATFFVSGNRPGFLTTNQWYVWFHRETRTTSPHPCLIQAPKPNDTIRLFVLGESAAMGTPKPAFSFGRVLELMLQDHFPNHRVEVVNAAMRGIDSHVVALISAECARMQPDLFLVYMGNNEVIGQHGPTTFLGRRPSLIGSRRRLMETRFAQSWRSVVANTAFGAKKAGLSDTMESFRKSRIALDDPRRAVTYRNYRRNLTRICDHALAAGAGVVMATVPVNLKDCPPLASLHRRDLTAEQLETWQSLYNRAVQDEKDQRYAEAIAGYQQAMTIDEHYADLHYHLARCHLTLGNREAARTHFSLARDWDALQFRTDSRLNDIIREVALERAAKGVHLVDAARRLGSDVCDSDGIPGNELFSDHVHYNFDGDYQLARLLLPAVVAALRQHRGLVGVESTEVLTSDQYAARLAYNAWEEVDSLAAIARMLARPPFLDQIDHARRQAALEKRVSEMSSRFDRTLIEEVVRSYDYAIALNPADWGLRYNYASFLYQVQHYRQAMPHIRYVVDMFGDIPAFRVLFGYCLGASGYLDQSIEQFRLARRLDKHSKQIEEALAWAQQRTQDRTQHASH